MGKRKINIDKLLGIDHNPSRSTLEYTAEDLESRARDVWERLGFKHFQIQMGIDYAHGRTRSVLRKIPRGFRKLIYPTIFKEELRNATAWLFDLKRLEEEGESNFR